MPETLCRHCRRGKVNRPRGLCRTCYYTPEVSALYPSASKYAARPLRPDVTCYVPGGMTRREVALVLGVSVSHVAKTEERALRKLAADPALRRIAQEAGLLRGVADV